MDTVEDIQQSLRPVDEDHALVKTHAAFEFELLRELTRATGSLTRPPTRNGNSAAPAA